MNPPFRDLGFAPPLVPLFFCSLVVTASLQRDADDDDARLNAKRDVVFVAKATLYAATALLITLVILPQAIAKYT